MRDYTKIEAWRLADDLTVDIYRQTQAFPREELYGLTSQLRRAISSVPTTISLKVLPAKPSEITCTFCTSPALRWPRPNIFWHLANRLGYLNETDAARLHQQIKQVFACLHGLTQAVARQAQSDRGPVVP